MTADVQALRERAAKIAERVLALHEQLIINCDDDSLDQTFEREVAQLHAAEKAIAVAIRKQGGR